MIQFVGVVVPARDEEASIAACLASVERAARHPALRSLKVGIFTVLDDCSDTTGDRVTVGRTLETGAGNVGRARAAGFEVALAESAGLDPSEVWLATTDADSRVPPDWLAVQLAWADRGADAVAGTVRVDDWSQQPGATRRRFLAHQRRLGLGYDHGHVHGANLGLTAAAYRAAGGVPGLPRSEDHALWQRVVAAGGTTVKPPDLTVVTSARREARAEGGFASLLRQLGCSHGVGA